MILFFFWLFYIYISVYFLCLQFGKNFTIISQDILSQIANMMQTTD